MKFEQKHPDAKPAERFEFGYSFVTKSPRLGECRNCRAYTRWVDVLFEVNVCGDECGETLWRNYREDEKTQTEYENFEKHFENVKAELVAAEAMSDDPWKDIIMVVHDQLAYTKEAVETIMEHTKNYHLYIWDNGSQEETKEYLENLMRDHGEEEHFQITVVRSDGNTGFIYPNNELAALGESEYIILINSDTKVFRHWDRAMIAFLRANPDVKEVGYRGGHLDATCRGFGGGHGWDIDYVPGWCLTISRDTYEEFGLFDDEHLVFAYAEDCDLSLRLKEAGYRIYALHAPLCHHYQNKTSVVVEKEGVVDMKATFAKNHDYMRERWKDYLENDRVVLRLGKESRDATSGVAD